MFILLTLLDLMLCNYLLLFKFVIGTCVDLAILTVVKSSDFYLTEVFSFTPQFIFCLFSQVASNPVFLLLLEYPFHLIFYIFHS